MSTISYCIKHQSMETVYGKPNDRWHLVEISTPYGLGVEDCDGPFAECPPPDDMKAEDWQDRLILPSHDEYFNIKFDFLIDEDQIVMLDLI